MSLLRLYFLKKTAFLKDIPAGELYQQAESFWRHLDSAAWIFMVIVFAGALFAVWYYYGPYNNQPGRHYRRSCWVKWLCGACGAVFVATLAAAVGFAWPKPDGALLLELRVAALNAVYAAAIYFCASVAWCYCFPTNAYRLFKK